MKAVRHLDEIKVPMVIKAITDFKNTAFPDVALVDVLEKLSGQNGWNKEDEAILAGTPGEEYYKIFKNTRGCALDAYIKVCAQFNASDSGEEGWKNIFDKAKAALERIGAESLLNAMRVRKHGIKIQSNTNERAL